jgi:hypothetical protein
MAITNGNDDQNEQPRMLCCRCSGDIQKSSSNIINDNMSLIKSQLTKTVHKQKLSKTNRQVIIEQLPVPPAKPRDIILEKWIPKEYLESLYQVIKL